MPPRFVARQFAFPHRDVGRLMALSMNRHNANMNTYAVEMLEVQPSCRVLELGFGGGVTLPALVERAGFVCGVDRDAAMVKRAKALHSKAVGEGRADFRQGVAEALHCEDASFDRACTVNTIYFWPSLKDGFREIHRVLAAGGRLVVGFLPKERIERLNVPPGIFMLRTSEDVVSALQDVGFNEVQVRRPTADTPWVVVTAER